jgi:hypothetical protein
MSEVFIDGSGKLKFEYKSITADARSLIPRLSLEFEIHYISSESKSGENVFINFGRAELKVRKQVFPGVGERLYVGSLIPEERFFTLLSPNSSSSTRWYIDLDHYRLSQLEKIREGKDLQMCVDLFLIVELQREPPSMCPIQFPSLYIEVPKSDWVEKILPQLKYKEVSLIELPKLDGPEFSNIIAEIDKAWKMYSMGEYKDVLTKCRIAIEGLTSVVKSRGFHKEVEEEGKKKTVPDWERALGHEKMGDLMRSFIQKLYDFLSPGSHYGKSIDRGDAELAIMMTHALINFCTKKLLGSSQNP